MHWSTIVLLSLTGINASPISPASKKTISPALHGRAENDCTGLARWPPVSDYECKKKDANRLLADGTCPVPGDGEETVGDLKCVNFCEVRKTLYMGPETPMIGKAGETLASGTQYALTEGTAKTTSIGFSVGAGISDMWKSAVEASLSFSYSVSYESSYQVQLSADGDTAGKYKDADGNEHTAPTRWVSWQKMEESCGTTSQRHYKESEAINNSACNYVGCQVSAPEEQINKCTGPVVSSGNVCIWKPVLGADGKPSFWTALRHDTLEGRARKWDEQHQSYRDYCQSPENPHCIATLDGGEKAVN